MEVSTLNRHSLSVLVPMSSQFNGRSEFRQPKSTNSLRRGTGRRVQTQSRTLLLPLQAFSVLTLEPGGAPTRLEFRGERVANKDEFYGDGRPRGWDAGARRNAANKRVGFPAGAVGDSNWTAQPYLRPASEAAWQAKGGREQER